MALKPRTPDRIRSGNETGHTFIDLQRRYSLSQ
jgi:hypothetical protein